MVRRASPLDLRPRSARATALMPAIAADLVKLTDGAAEPKHLLALFEAISTGNSARIDALSAHFVPRGTLVNGGLIAAAVFGDLELLRRFHQSGADLAARGPDALLWACRTGSLDCVRYLHQQGTDIIAHGAALLEAACAAGSADVVRYLHHNGVPVGPRDVAFAVAAAHAGASEVLRYLFASGLDIGIAGEPAIDAAYRAGRSDVVDYLARCGVPRRIDPGSALVAEIDRDAAGDPGPLSAPAPSKLQKAMAAALRLARGLMTRLESTIHGVTDAVARGDLRALRAYARKGIDLNVGKEGLLQAARQGHADTVSELAHWRFDFVAHGSEALVEAARNRQKDAVKRLHEAGAQDFRLSPASRASLDEMFREIERAEAIYQPSRFWEFFSESNVRFLGWGGEENFKRTVNQNYFNFIPELAGDPKVAYLDELERRLGSVPHDAYSIEDPDHDPQLWWSWYDSYLIFKGDRESRLRLYKRFVATLFEYALREDRVGLLDRLEEPALGNPLRIRRDGRLVSQDLANSALELDTLFEGAKLGEPAPGTWFGELGAGYGRLGAVLLNRFPVRYAVFDIPPALHVSQWYLSNLFPSRRVFRFRHFERFNEVEAELRAAEIAFFTPNQLALIPDRFFPVMMTVSSLHEMRREQVGHYLGLLGRKAACEIYLKQQWRYPNPHDEIVIEARDYVAPPGWQVSLARTDRVNPEFFEQVLTRADANG